ncbi:MAG TPA: 6-phosphogluconolactonase [Thermomicrobiales bacterium]|nr:6-phosphogluconolactonase [Thermomicrobiales bacterium]
MSEDRDERTVDYGERGQVIVVPDGDALARLAAETLTSVIAEARAQSRNAAIALSGGSTPKKMGELLARPPYIERVHWDAVEIFWGDERFVPLSDSESNAGEAMRTFLQKVPIPDERVHPYETELGDPDVAAERYARDLRAIVPLRDGIPTFDLILLGMGDDGHTASLFPGTAAIHEDQRFVVAHRVEKLDAMRLTLTPPVINAAEQVVFLVGGNGKAGTLHAVLDGEMDIDTFPSQVVRPVNGSLLWVVDRAAADRLDRRPNDG